MDNIDIILITYKKKEEVQKQINEIETNTPEKHRLIATCQPLSAAHNRNYGLSWANSEIIIQMDDDIFGFYNGWLTDFVEPMIQDKSIIISSARLLNKDKTYNDNMGMGANKDINYADVRPQFTINGIAYKRVTTACLAFRKNNIRFDEEFKKSGYEDTSWSNDMCNAFPKMRIIVNNKCKLIHLNEMKGQDDKEIWQHNHNHYCEKYPWDKIAERQKCWYK